MLIRNDDGNDDDDNYNNHGGVDESDDARFELLLAIKVFWHLAFCCWMTGSRIFEGTTHPNAQRHIQEDLNLILMDPCIVDNSVEIPTRCSFVIEFIIPKLFKGSICFERHTAHHQEL